MLGNRAVARFREDRRGLPPANRGWLSLALIVILNALILPVAYSGALMVYEGSRSPWDYAAIALGGAVIVLDLAAGILLAVGTRRSPSTGE